jgi:hypothetical protein
VVVEAVHNYLDTVGGIGRTTKAKARAAARSLQHSISAEVEKTSGRLGLVRTEELAEIRSELTELKTELADARSGLAEARAELTELRDRADRPPSAPQESSSNGAKPTSTAAKAPVRTTAKKTVAKRTVAKKTVAKKPATKKAPGRTTARKTPAKKAEKANE